MIIIDLCFGKSLMEVDKICFNSLVEGVQREYFLHIPGNYINSKTVPLVFMLDGTSEDVDKMYVNSEWTEFTEIEGFIADIISSLWYKIITQEEDKNTTKWNILPESEWILQSGKEAKDDIKILRKIIDEVSSKYKIDQNIMNLNDFSNGGQMAAKSGIEMSDLFATICMNAGSFYRDINYIPEIKIPISYQVGERDYLPVNVGSEFPEIALFYIDSLLSTPGLPIFNSNINKTKQRVINNFQYKSEYVKSGNVNRAIVATFLPIMITEKREFKFIYVKNPGHSYLDWSTSENWKWMKKYNKEEVSDRYSLTINEGYGAGMFLKDDKTHVWAKQIDGKVFTHWTGDVQYLSAVNEYHSIITMPNKNISITANYENLTPRMQMSPFKIKAASKEKEIYVYSPIDRSKTKGVVWIFHGTNGNALNMITDPDVKQMIDLLMVKDYAVVALTSEESEFKIDFNGDGVYRYTYGLDSALIDQANVKVIRDSMIRRNLISQNTPNAAIGWSAGGAFTEFLANVFNWKAAINHTSPGTESLSLSTSVKVPYLASINENDRNPEVGKAGNDLTKKYVQNYRNRGACAILHEHLKAPLYPERFDRSTSISEALSRIIYNELKSNNLLDTNNYLVLFADQLFNFIESNSSKFPVITALNSEQKNAVRRQVQVINAEHNIKADINGMTLDFIENGCKNIISDFQTVNEDVLLIFPNPSEDWIYVTKEVRYNILNLNGVLQMKGTGNRINISGMLPGFYLFEAEGRKIRFAKF